MNTLAASDIRKTFGSTVALDGACLHARAGEVVGLVGANGAGKSTLVKILSGALTPDSGEIGLGDWSGPALTPRIAQRLGVATIYQDPSLVPTLGLVANLVLGREATRIGFLRSGAALAEARRLLERVGLDPQSTVTAGQLSPAGQQLLEIAKALYRHARLVIMDEPTAALGETETRRLFELIGSLAAEGVAIVYISHRLDEVLHICDRVAVMRDGRTISDRPSAGLTEEDLVRDMIGHEVAVIGRGGSRRAEVALSLRGVGQGTRLDDVTFDVHAGEVVGITGLVGSGRSRLVRALFGIEQVDRGEIELFGAPFAPRSPRHAISRGVGFIPEDRKRDALLLSQSAAANVTLADIPTSGGLFVRRGEERRIAERLITRLQVKAPSVRTPPANLSGGNQQKLVVARWLHADSRLIIFDEPGQGVDVGAKEQILRAIRDLAGEGRAVVVVSQEVDELQQVADRVVVMRRGTVAGILDADEVTEDRVVALSMGVDPARSAPTVRGLEQERSV